MAEPLVSVVTPSYNQAEFIEDAILSVKNQDYSRVEHVVVDGGSNDGTLDVLRRYEDEYQLTWISESDEGQSHAINKGFDRVSGDIVGWLNSDDVYFDIGVFSRVVRYFEEYDADIIYGDIGLIDGNSTVIGVSARPSFDIDQLMFRNLIAQPATFFRGPVVSTHHLNVGLDYSMDYEFWLRLAQEYSFVHVQDVLAGFRYHEDQKTGEVRAMREEGDEVSRYYHDENAHRAKLFRDIIPTELARWRRNIELTSALQKRSTDLAFPGDIASAPRMLMNVLPKRSDVHKALGRIRELG